MYVGSTGIRLRSSEIHPESAKIPRKFHNIHPGSTGIYLGSPVIFVGRGVEMQLCPALAPLHNLV